MQKNNQYITKILNVPKPVQVIDFVDPQCFFYYNLSLKNNVLVAQQWALVFGKNVIKQNYYSFTVTIESMDMYIGLGFIDTKYNKIQKLYKIPNVIVYWSKGYCWDGKDQKHNQGHLYKLGQSVTITMNKSVGSVQWRVGHHMRHKVQVQTIKDLGIEWVPYIYLPSRKDKVIISQ